MKSHHHQGFGRVGEGLRVSAHAEDGSPEAVEASDRRFALGVLWHPEAGEDARLFEALVEQAREYRATRGHWPAPAVDPARARSLRSALRSRHCLSPVADGGSFRPRG